MNIKYKNVNNILDIDLDKFEKNINIILPIEFKNFFKKYNGVLLENNIFSISKNNESGVNNIIPLNNIIEEQKLLQPIDKNIYPIANAEGGNYVVIDFNNSGTIYFWDHELIDNLYMLSENIEIFFNNLKAFSVDDIELNDNEVESVWIDPDFLKSINQKNEE